MRVGIVGAGAAGLAAAYDLTRAGHEVTVFEGGASVGGLAAGFKPERWDWTLEKFYHHWFASDKAILGLIAELGWRDDVLFPRPYTVIYHKGDWVPFDSPAAIVRFMVTHFSPVDVARFVAAAGYLRLTPRWQPLEKTTADAWMRRWFGDRVYEALWKPLLVGKFGEENLRTVNMAWMWARLHARTTRLGTFKGGFQAFMDRLAAVDSQQGAEIRLNAPVSKIERRGDHIELQTAASADEFDVVISTTSPALMAKMAPQLPDDYAGRLLEMKSMGAVVLVLALDRQLTKYYWHNIPKDAGFPFLALVEHTNYMSPEHYGGDHIVYCGDYLDASHEYFQLSKEQLLERFEPALKRFNPEFDASWVRETWLWKTPYAQPVPPVGHSSNIPPLRTPVEGLYFASMSQVYPWDRGTNFAVELGRKVAALAMEDAPALTRRAPQDAEPKRPAPPAPV